jgi:hypothetical protein
LTASRRVLAVSENKGYRTQPMLQVAFPKLLRARDAEFYGSLYARGPLDFRKSCMASAIVPDVEQDGERSEGFLGREKSDL